MADQLATPQDLASLLELDWASLSAAQQDRLTMLVEIATGLVQAEASGQRIVEVVDDVIAEGDFMGTTARFLQLPQWPVSDVSDVEVDGVALTAGTDYKRVGSRLWRRCGWATYSDEPSIITLTYTHGYPTGDQRLQFGRNATLGLARLPATNPSGAESESIDDYRVSYEAMAAAMDASEHLREAIARNYGPRAGLVRLG